jgi:chitinase
VLSREQTLVLVDAGKTTLVAITLRPPQAVVAGPIILVATASASQVDFDQTVSLAASATDEDPAQVPNLRLSWSASVGSFVGPTDQGTATWKAPSGPTSVVATLRLTATDSLGLEDSKTLDVVVGLGATSALVVVEINSWPRIDAITTDALLVPTGGLAHLHGVAHDPDGDALSYSWSLDACQGTFPGGSSGPDANLRFVVQAAQQTCTVRLTVSDGRGGTARGSLTLTVAPPR